MPIATRAGAAALTLTLTVIVAARAQERRDEQFYYPGAFNWTFLRNYPQAARLFNASDYRHAVLYERLYTVTDSARQSAALNREYLYLTGDLLVRPRASRWPRRPSSPAIPGSPSHRFRSPWP